jgi:hypothetical protein
MAQPHTILFMYQKELLAKIHSFPLAIGQKIAQTRYFVQQEQPDHQKK